MINQKIGFGGGCHWCTEAYFQSLIGVEKVEQGWISSDFPNDTFSEAIIVYFNAEIISLRVLVAIHLATHSATNSHNFREKYRSAVYVFDKKAADVQVIIDDNQADFKDKIITKALNFVDFKINIETQQNYYKKNKEGQFCERYISPKLQLLALQFSKYYKSCKID